MPLQIREENFLSRAEGRSLASLKARFARFRCVLLPRFIEPSLLKALQKDIRPEDFYERKDKGIAAESCMKKNRVFDFFHFLLNDEAVFRAVENITGCGTIRNFQGRLYRLMPGTGHYDSWHNDMGSKRMIGMSINLGEGPYMGGFLELRHEPTQKILRRIQNRRPGDALLFKISQDLKHRVTPVFGENPRVAFAGWFHSSPRFSTLIR